MRSVWLLVPVLLLSAGCGGGKTVEERLTEVETGLNEEVARNSQRAAKQQGVNGKQQTANKNMFAVLKAHDNEIKQKISRSELSEPTSDLSRKLAENARKFAAQEVETQLAARGGATGGVHETVVVQASSDPPPNAAKDHSEDITKLRAEIAQLKTQNKPKDYSGEIKAMRAEVAARLANTVDRFRPQQPQAANGVLCQVVQDVAPKAGAPSWYRWAVPQGKQPVLEAYYVRACACGRCQQQCFWGVVPPERMPSGFPRPPAIEYEE